MNTLPNNASLIKNPLGLNVPSHLWVDIYFAPKDGSRLIGRDVLGNIDMIKWWGSCWWTKNNICSKIIQYTEISEDDIRGLLIED